MGSPRLGSPAPAKAGINRQLTAAGNTMHPQDLLRSCAHRMLRRLPFLQRSRALLGWPQRCSPTLDIVLSWLHDLSVLLPFLSHRHGLPACWSLVHAWVFHSSFFTQAFSLKLFFTQAFFTWGFHLRLQLGASLRGLLHLGASSVGASCALP